MDYLVDRLMDELIDGWMDWLLYWLINGLGLWKCRRRKPSAGEDGIQYRNTIMCIEQAFNIF